MTKSEIVGLAIVALLMLTMVLWRQCGRSEVKAVAASDVVGRETLTTTADKHEADSVAAPVRKAKARRHDSHKRYSDRNPLNDIIPSP